MKPYFLIVAASVAFATGAHAATSAADAIPATSPVWKSLPAKAPFKFVVSKTNPFTAARKEVLEEVSVRTPNSAAGAAKESAKAESERKNKQLVSTLSTARQYIASNIKGVIHGTQPTVTIGRDILRPGDKIPCPGVADESAPILTEIQGDYIRVQFSGQTEADTIQLDAFFRA